MTEQVLAVQRMQDYIEKNQTEEIRLSDLAQASLFSPWYSYRLFRDCLGLTPTEYIRKYRLTQAAKQLRGGEVWGILMSMKSLCGEPVSMWLPEKYKNPNTSTYVQGVEVETDYMGMIPEGFDTIHLPEAEYLMFQGQPFREEDYCEAIRTVQAAMDSYDPSVVGYRWDDENPRIQLEPRGQRGYIELRAVRRVQK